MLMTALGLGLAAAGAAQLEWTYYSAAQHNLFEVAPTKVERLSKPSAGLRLTARLTNTTGFNLCFSTGWAFGADRPENIIPELAIYDLASGKGMPYLGPVADIEHVWPYYRVLAKGGTFEPSLFVDDGYYKLQKGHRYHLDYAVFAYDCARITEGQYNLDPYIIEYMIHRGEVRVEASYHGVIYHLSYDFTYEG